ncbi:MAG: sphingosine kinase [Actinobacteria bacterium]|nr:sphingosine kinase [Actinomycetota bacterium]
MTRLGVAVNPTSGRGRGAAHGAVVERALAAAGADVVHLVGSDAVDLAARVAAALPTLDALVVVGGDGMVHLGANAVAGTTTPLGIVAAGTGNDTAIGLGLPVHAPDDAARVVLDALDAGAYRDIDAARVTRAGSAGGADDVRWFAGVLGLGFDAVVNERANRMRWPKGRRRYDVAIALELPVFRPREYTLRLDGAVHDTRAMLVAVANGRSYGGGMNVCPDALFDDGLLDVLVVEPVSRLEFVRIFPKVFSGTHVTHPKVRIERAARVEIAAAGIVGYGDGERMQPLPVTVECVRSALRLLAPAPPG